MPVVISGSSSTSTAQAVATVAVFDYVLDSQGNALPNETIKVTLQGPSVMTSIAPATDLEPITVSATTDANGFWQVLLVPNTNISPTGTVYVVSSRRPSYRITVGAAGPYQSTASGTIVTT